MYAPAGHGGLYTLRFVWRDGLLMSQMTLQLWASIEETLYPAILAHPFLKQLQDGSLPEAAFRHYVCQDALYLRAFGRGLALLAARAPDGEGFMTLSAHARNTLVVEGLLHEAFLNGWKIQKETLSSRESPTCLLYTGYLLRQAQWASWPEALASYLPCYWIYLKVGLALAEGGSPSALYQRWIDTYAGEAFAEVVGEMRALVDAAGAVATGEEQATMRQAFLVASRCEWMFWDSAYRQERWPV